MWMRQWVGKERENPHGQDQNLRERFTSVSMLASFLKSLKRQQQEDTWTVADTCKDQEHLKTFVPMSSTYILENLTDLRRSSLTRPSSFWNTGPCCSPGLWRSPLPSLHSSSPCSSWKITSALQWWHPVHREWHVSFEFYGNERARSSSSGQATDELNTEVQPR